MATSDTAKVERILDALAQHGGRRTATRRAIVEALLASGNHVTASDLAERVPGVDLSTVYRTLDALEQIGVLDHVHLGHGRAIFHLADQEHQHLACEECGGVTELPPDKLKAFLAMIESDFGFRVDRRHFAIVGRCANCL